MAALENIFISGSSGLQNQDLQKDLRINIINGKSINSLIYTAPTADGKTYDFIDSGEQGTRCDT